MKASAHQSSEFTRLLVMGPSGTGKTGGLLSLILAGYDVRVIDMDNGLDWLVNKLRKDHPDKLDNLDYVTFRDKYKMTDAGPTIVGVPKAYTNAIKAMEKWDDGSVPSDWGPKKILVLDSLTFFGNAAFAWKEMLNPPQQGKKVDRRQIYGLAQDAVADILDAVTGPEFKTNVIVFTHVRWNKVTDDKGNTTIVGGMPSAIGEALGDKIGTYFNTVGLAEKLPGAAGRRQIRFTSTGLIDLKSSVVSGMEQPVPLETGLADFFRAAKGG